MFPEIHTIEHARKRLKLTQKVLASRAGISQSLIAKIESGKINPSYEIVKKIFEVFEQIEKEFDVKSKDIMNKNVVFVKDTDTIERAIEKMRKNGYSQLPVVERSQVVGTISEKIILDIISEHRNLSETLKNKVESVMGDALPRINESEPISTVSALLKTNSAVLVTKGAKTVGIITKADLFKMADKE